MKKNYSLLKGVTASLMVSALGLGSMKAQLVTQTLSYTGSIQTFTIPSCVTQVSLDVRGAQGGFGSSGTGGLGARMTGVFTVTPGQVFSYLVGQSPGNVTTGGYTYPAGGGGSFWALGSAYASATPVIVAGGGGGGFNSVAGDNGTVTTSGTGATPGTSGNGAPASGCGGGGGGFYTSGGNDTYYGFIGGSGFQQGGAGGTASSAYSTFGYQPGGFGGGAPADYIGTCNLRAGAGGGYSGGSGYSTSLYDEGSAGGSYSNGTSQVNTSGFQSGNGQIIISYYPIVPITVSATSSAVCTGATLTLTASGMSTYTYAPVGSFAGSNSASVAVSPTTTTTYSLTGTSSTGCPGNAFVTINVSPGVPTLTFTPSSPTVCSGNTVTVSGSGALTYTFSNSISNGVAFTPASGTNVYTLTGANGCGTSVATTTVIASPLPITTVASSTLICAGTPATLTASGATSYTWNPGASTNTTFIVSPNATTIYTVNGKTGICTGVATLTVTTKANPTLSIVASSSVICSGDVVNLSVNGNAATYTWNPGGPGANISATPTAVTLFQVTGTNSVNCSSTTQQVIIVNPLPIVNASVSNALVCSGGASTLSASGASTYAWSSGATGSVTVVNPITDATYTVTGSSALGCVSSTMVTVGVYAPSITVSSNTSICSGGNVVIGASAADTYMWSNSQTGQNITVSPILTTVYTVTASVNNLNGLNCDATGTVEVDVNPNPTVTAVSSPSAICIGQSATLTAEGAGTSGTYTWTGGSAAITTATNMVAPIADQTYTVNGTDANGCKGKGTIQLRVFTCDGIAINSANTANLSIYPNPNNGEFTISADQAITLQITNELGQQVKTVTLNKNSTDVKINSLPNGVYFITGSNENGSVKQKIVITK
jgi:hypothetical protein